MSTPRIDSHNIARPNADNNIRLAIALCTIFTVASAGFAILSMAHVIPLGLAAANLDIVVVSSAATSIGSGLIGLKCIRKIENSAPVRQIKCQPTESKKSENNGATAKRRHSDSSRKPQNKNNVNQGLKFQSSTSKQNSENIQKARARVSSSPAELAKQYGVTGIKNGSATCYLISLMQMILADDELRLQLRQQSNFEALVEAYEECSKRGEPLASFYIAEVFKHDFFAAHFPHLRKARGYQDIQEFFNAFLDAELGAIRMGQDCRELTVSEYELPKEEQDKTVLKYEDDLEIARDSFSYRTKMQERTWIKDRPTFNGFLGLPFSEERQEKSIQEMLQNYFYEKYVSFRDEKLRRKFLFEGETKQRDVELLRKWKRNWLSQAPDHLYLSPNRMMQTFDKEGNFGIDYIDNFIYCPLELEMPKECFLNKETPTYELKSFACFIHWGHYISYVKKTSPDGSAYQWFRCNDSRVTPIAEEDAVAAASTSYIMHYKKRS